MKRKAGWLTTGVIVLGLVLATVPARAGGIDDFKLTRAIPADSMLVVHFRDHAGKAFVDEQFKRVWAAIEKQNFDRDVKRLLRNIVKEQAGDVEEFDRQWQQITDLATSVAWSQLCQREGAFALKIGMPTGAEFVLLLMPPEDLIAKDFDGLTAILKNLVALAPKDLVLNSEGAGDAAVHRVSLANELTPMGLTLARHKDVLLVGFGGSLVEQSLALLRGESKAEVATLASTDRFKQAMARLPAPADSLGFVDMAKIMAQARVFAKLLPQLMMTATSAPAEAATQPADRELVFLTPLIDAVDLCEYTAGVATTNGMKTTTEEVTVLRDDARSRALYKVLYGGGPVRDPLKFIPKEATGVTVMSGLDFGALYQAILDFVGKELPDGQALLALWQQKQKEISFDVQEDVLSWLGGGFASFTATRASAYAPDWVYMIGVRDDQKAAGKLNELLGRLSERLAQQGGGVEDAKLEGLEGFKVIMLPPIVAMMLGQPVVGVKEGHLFIASGPKIVALALKVAAGELDNFSKSERFAREGLPLGENVTAFSFKDLTKLGEELGQALALVGVAQVAMPQLAKDPMFVTAMSVITKIGKVVRTLDFFRSSCAVTTFDGKASLSKSVTNYQEPPKPKAPESAPAEMPPGEQQGAKSAPEKEFGRPQ